MEFLERDNKRWDKMEEDEKKEKQHVDFIQNNKVYGKKNLSRLIETVQLLILSL